MKRIIASIAILLILAASVSAWSGAKERAKIVVNGINVPTADELRGTRVRLTGASGLTYDFCFFIDENPPDYTVPVGLVGQSLNFRSIVEAIDDAIQSDPNLTAEFAGYPGLVIESLIPGNLPDARVIGGAGKITVSTTQQGR